MRIGTGRPPARARVARWALAFIYFSSYGASPASGQVPEPAVIQGRILDEAGVGVVAALVELLPASGAEALRATTTAADGGYLLAGIVPGAYRLRVRRLSFETQILELELGPGHLRRMNIVLTFAPLQLDPLLVESSLHSRRERARFEADAGTTARVVTTSELKALPGLAEADVLRAVEVLPGVVSTSDFSSAFNVRGGSADQNLILLDGFPIFNPFHLGGLFSVFNADLLARAELLAGGFGAEHGGRVSSVLNVETRDYTGAEFGGAAGLSLLASRLSLHGSLPTPASLPGGWYLSARRSYFDQLLPADVGLPYHLTDLQAGLTLGLPGDGQLRFTAYTGDDVLDMSKREPKRRAAEGEQDDDGPDLLRMKWNWGNDLLGLRWDQPWGGWVATARLGFSRFGEGFGLIDQEGPRYQSRVRQLFARADLARDLAPGLALRLGAEGSRLLSHNTIEGGGTTFWDERQQGTLAGAFTQLGWRPAERWLFEPGLRLDAWRAGDTTIVLLSPRLAAKRFLGAERDAALKVALGRYTQFLHSLKDETLPIGNDTWVLAGPYLPAVTSDQVQLGVEKYWGERWSASAESYYRSFRGLAIINAADDLNDPADDYLQGRGHSYGLDLQVRKNTGRWSGWTTVSLLKAERTFPDALAGGWEETPTLTYAPGFDRRLDIDLVLQFTLPKAMELGLRWNFGSGLPYTRAVAQHLVWEYEPSTGRYRILPPQGEEEPDEPPTYVVLGPRNGARYPAYHRVDLSLRRTYQRRWGTATPYLQVLNLYNRKNPLFYFDNFAESPAVRSGISMFPILPTIGVEVTF